MSVDRLIPLAHQLAVHVEAVIAGGAVPLVAQEAGMTPDNLDDAVQAFRAAGIAALHAREEAAWFHARVQPVDWAIAETVFAAGIGPRIDGLEDKPAWWFLRKHPSWRVRIHTPDHEAVSALLDGLVSDDLISDWQPGIYEPETAAFSGIKSTAILHDLFCADSRGVLTYARTTPAPIGRRELSLLLIRAMQEGANLDWFEAADVFDRLGQMRPAPTAKHQPQVDSLAQQMLPLLALGSGERRALFATGGSISVAADWLSAFETVGRELGKAGASGCLGRGLRAVLAQLIIFHWNRLGLPAHTQGILAHAATSALLPRS